MRQEEEERKAAEAEARKQRQRERRADLKKQGLLLTGKAKREAERLAAMREQLLRNAGLDADAGGKVTIECSLCGVPAITSQPPASDI